MINGVGTEFLEIMEDLPDIDVMIVPLGAGSEAAAAIGKKGFSYPTRPMPYPLSILIIRNKTWI